jgi:hypothetical protein
MSIESCSTLGAEVAVTGVEIECTDAEVAASTLELYSAFYPIGSVVFHHLIVVFGSEARMHHGGLSKVTSLRSLGTTVVSRVCPKLAPTFASVLG